MDYTIKQGESLWFDITTDISAIDSTWPGTWHGEWAISLLPLPSSAAASGSMVPYDGVMISTNTLANGAYRSMPLPRQLYRLVRMF